MALGPFSHITISLTAFCASQLQRLHVKCRMLDDLEVGPQSGSDVTINAEGRPASSRFESERCEP